MNAIKATWTNGQILPAEPVDWPEGSQLLVEPLPPGYESWQSAEASWKDDPESIAKWCEGVRKIEPLVYTDEERAEMDRYFQECRKFNLEAVRQQMTVENCDS